MKRDELIRKIRKAASKEGVTFDLEREGAKHSIFRCGSQQVSIPRHREINEITARSIMADLQDQLGSGWWK